jgi:hypothetical protein
MTKERMEQLARESEAQVSELVKQNFIAEMARATQNAVAAEASKFAGEWAREQLVPAMRAYMAENKDGIIKAAIASVDGVISAMTKALVEQAQKSLASSHAVNDIMQRIFRGY